MERVGFSYVRFIFLWMLFIPNIIWTKKMPEGYTAEGESKVLRSFERMDMVDKVFEFWQRRSKKISRISSADRRYREKI